jgi:subtilisin family serine protease
MSFYIVRPKETLVQQVLGSIPTSMAREYREARITEVVRLRAEDPVYQEIRQWISDSQSPASQVTKKISVSAPVEATAVSTAAEPAATSRQRRVRVGQRTKPGSSPDTPKVREALLTGTLIVDMSDEEAERMRRELPHVTVLKNGPIDLIPPTHIETTAKQKVTTSDLWHLEAIGLEAARGRGFQLLGTGITIAVLDTGIDETHPALNGKVTEAFTFDAKLGDQGIQQMVPSTDTHGHGTHVAGLICGETIGVAPGVQLISAVVLPEGKGQLAEFVMAMEWLFSRSDVHIVNISAGFPGYAEELRSLFEDALVVGLLCVAAVGNEGRKRTRSPGNFIEPISVGAAEKRDGRYVVPGFSSSSTLVINNYQYRVPDLVAPGKGVYSSVVGGGFEAWDGTSMATPIVSGIAALILEKYPEITLLELEDKLLSTCLDLDLPVERQGSGLVQVKAAL